MNERVLFSLFSATVLCACSSGSGGSNVDSVSFAELQDRGELLEGDFFVTADSDLPVSGSASYSGIALAAVLGEDGSDDDFFLAVGVADVDVDFSEQTISGNSHSFFEIDDPDVETLQEASGTSISGSIDLELTQVVAGENFYAGETEGSLTSTDNRTYDFDLPANGGFFGDNAEQVSIEAGEIVGDGGTVLAIIAE